MSTLLNQDEQQAAAEAPEYGLLPEGLYLCRVREVERWSSGISLCWKFEVADGPYAGREVWTWTSLRHESIGRTKTYLAKLGFGLDADPAEIVGTSCHVRVTIEPRSDTGEQANRVKQIHPYQGPPLRDEAAVAAAGSGDDDDFRY